MNRKKGIAAAVLVVVGLVLLMKAGPTAGGVEHFRRQLVSYGPWAVVISAALMIAQSTVAPLPGNVVAITNGLVFGPVWGAVLSWSTTLIGASICFLLSKNLGKPFAQKLAGHSLDRAERFFGKYGLHTMFIVRIVPFMPFDAISYVAGIVGVPYPMFLAATAIGIIPSILVYSYLGSIVVSAYWYVVIGVLTVALAGTVVTLVAMRKNRNTPFAPDRICDNV